MIVLLSGVHFLHCCVLFVCVFAHPDVSLTDPCALCTFSSLLLAAPKNPEVLSPHFACPIPWLRVLELPFLPISTHSATLHTLVC